MKKLQNGFFSYTMYTTGYKKNWAAMANPAIVKEICHNLHQLRLNKNMSQQQLADISGINRVSISRMEAGRAVTLLTLVQVLRALDQLDILDAFTVEPQVSPMQLLLAQEAQHRYRASKPRKPKPGL